MRLFIHFLVLFYVLSCSNIDDSTLPKGDDPEVISVNLDEAEPIYMSDYFSEINYFYLETPEERPMGRIWKMMIQDRYVALFDRARESVWIYTKDGEYVNEVSIPIGRGPGEVLSAEDVVFTEDHNLHILGRFKIVAYDLNRNFIDETETHFYVYDITYDPSAEYYMGYASNSLNQGRLDDHGGNKLLYFDKSGSITQSYLPIGEGKEKMGYNIPNRFPTYNDTQLFFAHLVDTVYAIQGDEVIPRYALDYGENAIPPDVFELRDNYNEGPSDWTRFMDEEIDANNYVAYLSYFCETNSFIQFDISAGEENYVVFYDKKSGTTNITKGKMTNDIDYGVTSYMYESHNDTLYTVISSNDLLSHLNDLHEMNLKSMQILKWMNWQRLPILLMITEIQS